MTAPCKTFDVPSLSVDRPVLATAHEKGNAAAEGTAAHSTSIDGLEYQPSFGVLGREVPQLMKSRREDLDSRELERE
jgi:hypothetical protein